MQFDFDALSPSHRYKLLAATVVPRPIAWVSTQAEDGRLNAAPFSFFNVFGEEPAVVGFSVTHRPGGGAKDTEANIRANGEFVVNLVSEDMIEPMVVSAAAFDSSVDEFIEAGLSPAPSVRIATPRIAQSRVSLECRLHQIVEFGERRSLVIGEVLMMHVHDDAVLDAERGWIDAAKLGLVGRMGANLYTRTADVMEHVVPSLESRQRGTSSIG